MNKFKDRQSSSIYKLRIFHNWVKRELISQTCNYLRENYDVDIALLDLSCGRGGDLMKYYNNNILDVVGFDIDENSIIEAKKRYHEMINQLKRKNVKNLPKYEFNVIDLSQPSNLPKIKNILNNKKFDIVSCQFAIHYFFKNKESLENLIKIVHYYLNKNGFFIGTTINGNIVKELFTDNSIITSDIFKLENKTVVTNDPYGNKYLVYLGKESDKGHYFVNKPSEEYLVDIDELKKVCSKYNLMFVGTIEFERWYSLFNKNILSDSEKEFSFLNFSFVFTLK